MPTHVESPDGKLIEFPDSMDMPAIQGAMQRLYPPTQKQAPMPALVWPPPGQSPSPQPTAPTSVAPLPNSTEVQDIDRVGSPPVKKGSLEELWDTAKTVLQQHLFPPMGVPTGGAPMYAPGPTVDQGLNATTGYKGYGQVLEGSKKLTYGEGAPTPTRSRMKGLADMIGGAMTIAQPLMIGAGMENPMPMIKGLISGTATSYGAGKATEALGGSEEAQDLASQVGGLITLHGLKSALENKPTYLSDVMHEKPVQAAAKEQVGNLSSDPYWLEHKPGDVGPAPEASINTNDLYEGKETSATPEQTARDRQRFLNNQNNIRTNYGRSLGPSTTYDPTTGEPSSPSSPAPQVAKGPDSKQTPPSQATETTTEPLPEKWKGLVKEGGKGYHEEKYPYSLKVTVEHPGDAPFQDEIKGLNKGHAYARARANWPDAKVTPIEGKGLGPSGAFAKVPDLKEGERGSLSFRSKPIIYADNSPMGRLANDIAREIAVKPASGSDRLSYGEKLAAKYGEVADDVADGFNEMIGHSVAMADRIRRPSPVNAFEKGLGEFSGDLQRNAISTRRFIQAIIDKVPDKLRREGITNYMNAKGNMDLLRRQAEATTDKRLRRGYEVAQDLTQTEKNIADKARAYFDTQLSIGQAHGFLGDGFENYLPNVWKGARFPQDLLAASRNYNLRPNSAFMKERFYSDYFHGEQMGFIPKDKDIGALIGAYNQSFNKALSSRAFIEKLKLAAVRTKMPDGSYKMLPAVAAPDATGKTFVPDGTDDIIHIVGKGKVKDDDLGQYRVIDHPALQGHAWATNSTAGDPIFYRGNLKVNPEIYDKLNNAFKTSSIQKHPLGRAALKASTLVKGTTLSIASFHQVQEGLHAIWHGVNPFNAPEINLTDPVTNKLFDSGLIAGGDNGMADFSEGLQGQGLLKYTPAGPFLHKYSNYLFNDYIPRLKVTMAKEAFERNSKRYKGDLSTDQIAKISAEQSNAAFGELNYKMLGRNPTVQDSLRLALLAPDFLEARARFVAQALKPYGQEQRVALVRGAIAMYIGARIINKITDDDYHWDKPFSVIRNGKEYEMRTIQGDILHLAQDPQSFVRHRLNPLYFRGGMEALTKRDQFGRKADAERQVLDFVKNMLPIPAQGPFEKKFGEGFKQDDPWDDALGAAAIGVKQYRTPAQTLARQIVFDHMDPEAKSKGISYLAAKIQKGKYDPDEVSNLLQDGKITPKVIRSAFEMAKQPELLRNFNSPNVSLKDAITIYALAHPDEKAQLASPLHRKMQTIHDLPPAEQVEIRKKFAEIQDK